MRMMPLVMVTFVVVALMFLAAVMIQLEREEKGAEGPFRRRENCVAKCEVRR